MAILWPVEKEAVSQTVGASKTRRNAKLDDQIRLLIGESVGRIFPVQ